MTHMFPVRNSYDLDEAGKQIRHALVYLPCCIFALYNSTHVERPCYHGRRNQSLQKQKKKTAIPSTVTCFILKRQHSSPTPKETKPVESSSTEEQKGIRRRRRKSCERMYDWTKESGTAMASVSSYHAAREDFSSRHSRPLQFVDLTRLLGGKPSVAWRQRQIKDSGEKSAEAAGPLVLNTHTWAWQAAKHGRE